MYNSLMTGKGRQKEEGLKPIRETKLFDRDAQLVKPEFILTKYTDGRTGQEFGWALPATNAPDYRSQVLAYLQGLAGELGDRIANGSVSFKINPKQLDQFHELFKDMDIYQRRAGHNILDISDIREKRKNHLGIVLQGKTPDRIGPNVTGKNSTIIEEKGRKILVVDSVSYRPHCNNDGPLGSITGIGKQQSDGRETLNLTWEVYNINQPFLAYLAEIHANIVGSAPGALDTLQVAKDGDTQLEARLSPIAQAYEGETVSTKFMHATGEKDGAHLSINHIDGAIMTYDFNTLRKRIFGWRDKTGRVSDKGYRKVFKIDTTDGSELAPMYNGLNNPEEHDLHDLVDVFMGRFLL